MCNGHKEILSPYVLCMYPFLHPPSWFLRRHCVSERQSRNCTWVVSSCIRVFSQDENRNYPIAGLLNWKEMKNILLVNSFIYPRRRYTRWFSFCIGLLDPSVGEALLAEWYVLTVRGGLQGPTCLSLRVCNYTLDLLYSCLAFAQLQSLRRAEFRAQSTILSCYISSTLGDCYFLLSCIFGEISFQVLFQGKSSVHLKAICGFNVM